MLATAGADRSDFDSKLCTPHDARACRVSAARDQQRARKSFVSSNQFDFNIIIFEYIIMYMYSELWDYCDVKTDSCSRRYLCGRTTAARSTRDVCCDDGCAALMIVGRGRAIH